MPCRTSGTGVLIFDGESVCISSAQGDDASQLTGEWLWWAVSSGDVAAGRSILRVHKDCVCVSIPSNAAVAPRHLPRNVWTHPAAVFKRILDSLQVANVDYDDRP